MVEIKEIIKDLTDDKLVLPVKEIVVQSNLISPIPTYMVEAVLKKRQEGKTLREIKESVFKTGTKLTLSKQQILTIFREADKELAERKAAEELLNESFVEETEEVLVEE